MSLAHTLKKLNDYRDYCWEVDEAKWFALDAAIKQVSYKGDREILKKAKDKLLRLE